MTTEQITDLISAISDAMKEGKTSEFILKCEAAIEKLLTKL